MTPTEGPDRTVAARRGRAQIAGDGCCISRRRAYTGGRYRPTRGGVITLISDVYTSFTSGPRLPVSRGPSGQLSGFAHRGCKRHAIRGVARSRGQARFGGDRSREASIGYARYARLARIPLGWIDPDPAEGDEGSARMIRRDKRISGILSRYSRCRYLAAGLPSSSLLLLFISPARWPLRARSFSSVCLLASPPPPPPPPPPCLSDPNSHSIPLRDDRRTAWGSNVARLWARSSRTFRFRARNVNDRSKEPSRSCVHRSATRRKLKSGLLLAIREPEPLLYDRERGSCILCT